MEGMPKVEILPSTPQSISSLVHCANSGPRKEKIRIIDSKIKLTTAALLLKNDQVLVKEQQMHQRYFFRD